MHIQVDFALIILKHEEVIFGLPVLLVVLIGTTDIKEKLSI